ncbi:hypothetical protein [Crossiella sp. CA198]|uniref:hypothetical protein n=1 Tax=Crossiella sp. CA198 TaxID=3455607 RepID=UPI003F8D58CE
MPLFDVPGTRRASTFSDQPPADFHLLGPLRSLGTLACTQTGFLTDRAPDFRFPGPLQAIPELCRAAAAEYQRRDATAFRDWLSTQAAALPSAATLLRQAAELPVARAELLLVPLIYLNHLWRQGSPEDEPASGPSTMPAPLAELVVSTSNTAGTIPRFNQIVMTMLAWELDGVSGGEALTYQDITALDRMRPAFWLNHGNQSELDLYRAFFAVEAFGAPIYGWGCHALECAKVDDRAGATEALRRVQAALRNVFMVTKRLIPLIDPDEFRRIQVTCGWIEDEVTGVASGYQLPFLLMLDALFHVNFSHPDVIAARANNLRFVPEDWQAFFRMIYDHQPVLKTWVRESGDAALDKAYRSCVDLFALFRQMHRHLGGQAIKGGTTTGRVFGSAEKNYEQFMDEMAALVVDTTAAGDLAAAAAPDSPAAAASRGVRP